MISPVIDFVEVSKRYPGPPPVDALQSCSLQVRAGEYLAIVGRSGSGKSTMLNIAGLLDRHTAGSYSFDGTDTANLSESDRTTLRATSVGFVFQAFHLLPHRVACENVELAMVYSGAPRASRRDAAGAMLARVGLGDRLSSMPAQLSGGERQRVALARALVNSPRLLLCDEPTGNLDSRTADQIMDLVDELHASGQTIVVITHDPAVSRRAERVVALRDGRLIDLDVYNEGQETEEAIRPSREPSG